MNFIFIQLIGIIALFFIVTSFQKNKRSFTLVSQLISGLLFAIHFFLLGAFTGAAMNGISAARALVFNLRDKNKWINNKVIMYLFVILFWVAGLLTWQGYISLLPVIAMTLECFALWSKNTKHLRILFLSARPLWIIYDLIVGSYAGLVAEIFIASSIIVAILRFDRAKKKK